MASSTNKDVLQAIGKWIEITDSTRLTCVRVIVIEMRIGQNLSFPEEYFQFLRIGIHKIRLDHMPICVKCQRSLLKSCYTWCQNDRQSRVEHSGAMPGWPAWAVWLYWKLLDNGYFNQIQMAFKIKKKTKKPKSWCMGQIHKVWRPVWCLLVVQDVEPQTLVVWSPHHSRQITQTSKELYPVHFLPIKFDNWR